MSLQTETPGFHVRRAAWDLDRDALRAVRRTVFVQEQGVPEDLEWDDADAQGIHLLALADKDGTPGEPVATARLLPTGQIGRMAVLPEWRGRGIGTALLRELLAIARQGSHPPPFLNAQVSALPFYLREGFVGVGAVFEEAGIPHQRMELRRTQVPVHDLPLTERVLHRDAGTLTLEGPTSIRAAGIRMAGQARRGLCLLTRDLDPVLYDDPELVAAVRRLAVHRRDLPVRILVFDAASVVHRSHRLLPLIHHLSSRIAVRCVAEAQRERLDAFLLADEAGFILRRQADIYLATVDFHAPLEARRLQAEFLTLWEQAEPSPELRRLHL
jgi:predicted GNAT family N-acyltransferase